MSRGDKKQLDWHCEKCGTIEPHDNEEAFPECQCKPGLKYDLDKTVREIEKFLDEHKFSDHYIKSMDTMVIEDNNS